MELTAAQRTEQDKLKSALLTDESGCKLEKLAATLFSPLLEVPVAVAKTGFQHGGDAGPAGQQGRRFRIECNRFCVLFTLLGADKPEMTSLSNSGPSTRWWLNLLERP